MKRACALLTALAWANAALAWPPPEIPRESVPEDMDPEVRKHVLRLYGRGGDQVSAARALGAMGRRAGAAAPYLASLLRDPVRHGSVGWSAARALMKMGEAAIEPTVLAMQFGGTYSRMRGFAVLTELKDPRTLPMLVSAVVDGLRASGGGAPQALRAMGQPALDYLTERVRDPNPEIRHGAVLALSSFPRTNVVELVSTFLHDDSPLVRHGARESLLRLFRDREAVFPPLNEAMRDLLRDPDPEVREQGIKIVSYTGSDDKVAAIAPLAEDPDHEVRVTAIDTLGHIESRAAADVLLKLPASDDPRQRETLIDALGRTADPRAVPRLAARLDDPEPYVREKAVKALWAFPGAETVAAFLRAARDADSLVRVAGVRGLANARDTRAVEALIHALDDPEKDIRAEATVGLHLFYTGEVRVSRQPVKQLPPTETLPLFDPRVHAGLVQALRDQDPTVQRQALSALSHRDALPAVEPVLGLVGGKNWRVQTRALDYLRRVDSLPALEPIRKALRTGSSRTRQSAARLLGSRKDAESFDVIAAMARSRDIHTAQAAVEALRHYGSRAVDPLEDALRHPLPDVARAAASALLRMEDPRGRDIVAKAVKDKNARVRRAAADALARGPRDVKTPALVAALVRRKAGDPRDRSHEELARFGKQAVPEALSLLREKDPRLRQRGAEVLGRIGEVETAPALVAALKDPEPQVRRSAILALARIGGDAAVHGLARALADPDASLREAAATALGGFEQPEAAAALARARAGADRRLRAVLVRALGRVPDASRRGPLVEALNDEHWYVRRAATEALGRQRALETVPALAEALDDDHWYVRAGALASLKAITREDLGPVPAAWQAWWQARQEEAESKDG